MRNRFESMKERVLAQEGHDHYHALGYYLTKSRSLPYFVAIGTAPSRHPWLENMRTLYRRLGWTNLIKFLDWCVLHHKHPCRLWISKWKNKSEPSKMKNEPLCLLCKKEPAIHQYCRQCACLTNSQKLDKAQELQLRKSSASLTQFARWNKLSRKQIQIIKQMVMVAGQIQGQYCKYDVYDRTELRTALYELQEIGWNYE